MTTQRIPRRPKLFAKQLHIELLESRTLLDAALGWSIGIEGNNGVTRSAVHVDPQQNIVVASSYKGTVDFDPGPGSQTLTAMGGANGDGFVAKYTPAEQLVWARSFGGASNDERVVRIDSDAMGNLYIAGFFASSTAQFGEITLTSQRDAANTPTWDAYVAKLDSAGNFVWAHRFGDVESDLAWDLSVTGSGEVLVAGAFRGTVDFDPSPTGEVWRTSAGKYDAVVWKLDTDGNFQWVRSFGGAGREDAYRVLEDADGNVLVTGSFMETVEFGDAANPWTFTSGSPESPDTFLMQLDAAGETNWVRHISGLQTVGAGRLTVDSSGSILTAGWFAGTVEFEGGTTTLSSTAEKDTYVAKWTADGTLDWVRQLEATGEIKPQRMVTDADGRVYLSGRFQGQADLDPASNSQFSIAAADADWDGFVVRLEPDGSFSEGYHFSGPAVVRADGIDLNSEGDLHVSGSFDSSLSLPNGEQRMGSGTNSTFMAKLFTAEGATRLLEDSFEIGTWNGLWVEDGQDDWFRSTQRATQGSYSAEVDGRANDATLTLSNPVNLSAYAGAELSFSWFIESAVDANEYVALDLYDGTNWYELDRLRGDVDLENAWHKKRVVLPAAYLHDDFRFRFRASMNRSNEDANVDGVQLIGTRLFDVSNEAPVADPQSLSVDEDTPLEITLTGSDPDGDALTFVVVDGPDFGELTGSGPNRSYLPNANYFGGDSFSFRVNDGIADSETVVVALVVNPVNDPPIAANDSFSPATNETLMVSAPGVLGNDSDVEAGPLTAVLDTLPTNGELTFYSDGGFTYTPDPGFEGNDSFTYRAMDSEGQVSGAAQVSLAVQPTSNGPNLSHGVIANVGDVWQTYVLNTTYTSMVLVATPQYAVDSGPGVVRIRNVDVDRFDVRVSNVGTTPFEGNVHFVAVEAGVYDEPGFKLEAANAISTQTSGKNHWVLESATYQQTYTNPVVVGQVVSANDADWAVFWASSGTRTSPPSASELRIGKHVGEDPDWDRSSETVSYLVVEATSEGVIEGLPFVAGVGADTVRGIGNGTYQYSYAAMPNAKAAVLSSAGMDGNDGGWPVLVGENALPASDGSVELAIDEDQLSDAERKHTTEQVAYLIIDPPASEISPVQPVVLDAKHFDQPHPGTAEIIGSAEFIPTEERASSESPEHWKDHVFATNAWYTPAEQAIETLPRNRSLDTPSDDDWRLTAKDWIGRMFGLAG